MPRVRQHFYSSRAPTTSYLDAEESALPNPNDGIDGWDTDAAPNAANSQIDFDLELLFQQQLDDGFDCDGLYSNAVILEDSDDPFGTFPPDLFSPSPTITTNPTTRIERIPITFRFMKRMTRFSGLLESFECGSLAERQQLLGQNPPMFPPWIPPSLAEKYAFASVFDSSQYALAGEAAACEPTYTESIVAILKDATLHKAKGSKISITCDRAYASLWFNSLEEVIFEDEFLLDDSISVAHGTEARGEAAYRRLEAIQAAYLVCLVQNWEGSKPNKRRIRSQRQLQIADVADFKWSEFIFLEMLIRTGTYIFLLDFAFVIFHNSPPRLVVPEMQMSLACPDDCFQASSMEECFVRLRAWTYGRPFHDDLTTYEAVEILCGPESVWTVESKSERLTGLSILNMFTLISGASSHNRICREQGTDCHAAMHSLMFHFQTSLASHSELSHIQTGLDRWMRLWTQSGHQDELKCGDSFTGKDMSKRVGFMRHADEFWLLAQVTLNDMRDPLRRRDIVGKARVASIAYDEADMEHVRNIVSGFQHLAIV
ncbi:unnamed protein product [Parascedosporium putredinis]|uniref:Transcription factor domain-containing protein n=1 Tax=Parascedosporium putredinis TaxID=1442378 RepID=A0A9P1MA82_9PEZI|nr:unnamed protein product [Parascedosporium putredinis]CAI7996988.1 unnamed protein product [Parascedosporium putredinis]